VSQEARKRPAGDVEEAMFSGRAGETDLAGAEVTEEKPPIGTGTGYPGPVEASLDEDKPPIGTEVGYPKQAPEPR
jgi:hypothetical protein